jgi:hypothetical protein
MANGNLKVLLGEHTTGTLSGWATVTGMLRRRAQGRPESLRYEHTVGMASGFHTATGKLPWRVYRWHG